MSEKNLEDLFSTAEGQMILKLRMAKLLTALQADFPEPGGQTALADAIGIKQSALSGYLSPEKKDSRMTSKETDALIVKHLRKKDPKWSLQELYSFLESKDSFKNFSAKLARRELTKKALTAQNLIDVLSHEEQLEVVQFIFDNLKKALA